MILAFILVLIKGFEESFTDWITVVAPLISAIAAIVAAFAAIKSWKLSSTIWENGNKQREADKKIEKDRFFHHELKELLKIYLSPLVKEFLDCKIDKDVFFNGNIYTSMKDQATFRKKFTELLDTMRMNLKHISFFVSENNRTLLPIFDDVVVFLYHIENVSISIQPLFGPFSYKKCFNAGSSILDAADRVLSRLEFILLFNNIIAFKKEVDYKEVDYFKEETDKLYICLNKYKEDFCLFDFPADQFKTIEF